MAKELEESRKAIEKTSTLTSALREIPEITERRELISRLQKLKGSEEFKDAVDKVAGELSGDLGAKEGNVARRIIDVIDWRVEKKLGEI